MAPSLGAFIRSYYRKLKRWQNGQRCPKALEDQRPVNSGRKAVGLCSECEKLLIDASISLDGDESQAWRRLRLAGKFCPDCSKLHEFNVRTHKSYVPHSVRAAVTPLVDMVLPYRRGPKFARMAGPCISRDWSGVQPGEWFCADDATFNHDFWYEDEDGQRHIARGESLVMIDLRTDYPLDFLLIAGKYNSVFIRSLTLSVHDNQGLPHTGFYFENGVWRSRLIEGPRRPGWACSPWGETERGLCDPSLGLEVRHAHTPRAKPIEGFFGIIQDRMRCEPGFVGFNERLDTREKQMDFRARVRSGKEHPANELLSMEQYRDRLSEIVMEFAKEPQNGKRLQGKSPLEAWSAALDKRQLRKLPTAMRYLLATHKTPVRVTQKGIELTVRGQRFGYYSADTGKFIGKDVLAFFNWDRPQSLVFSDLKRQEYYSVEAVTLPAMSATKEELSAVNEARNAHLKAAKALFGNIKHPLTCNVSRDVEHDAPSRALGQFINEKAEDERAAERAHLDRRSSGEREADEMEAAYLAAYKARTGEAAKV